MGRERRGRREKVRGGRKRVRKRGIKRERGKGRGKYKNEGGRERERGSYNSIKVHDINFCS